MSDEPPIRLWHDDVRPPPRGWVWVRTNDDARAILQTGRVIEASLDHDLGYDGPPPGECAECGGTGIEPGYDRKKRNSPRISRSKFEDPPCVACDGDGFIGGDVLYIAGTAEDDGYELVRWMVEEGYVPPKVTIHSWNPAGARNMQLALEAAGHHPAVVPYTAPAR